METRQDDLFGSLFEPRDRRLVRSPTPSRSQQFLAVSRIAQGAEAD